MRPEILRYLLKPATFTLLEGKQASGFLWWNNGWVWERWHWNRWPVELVQGTLRELAERTGSSMELVTDSFGNPPVV